MEGCAPGALLFIPAEVATRLTTLTSLTPVPGARPPVAGVAVAEGAVVAVLSVGPGRAGEVPRRAEPAVLCRVGDGVDVALTGGVVIATGLFEVGSDGASVTWGDALVEELDVAALYARAEATTWSPPQGSDAWRVEADSMAQPGGGDEG
jgi:hypothetical protein